ncbi:hypothetical protein MKX01_009838 [Papaver californicum]|nr:hypothetical protein MKX01_009838 [Papaver californicum]
MKKVLMIGLEHKKDILGCPKGFLKNQSYFKANPHASVVPSHIDAEYILYVVKGKGTISLVNQENRETCNLERGDVLRIPAGTMLNVINRDSKQKLQFAEFFQSISIPGKFRNPESYLNSFSSEVLEDAFNTPRDQIEKLFGQQKKGMIIKASVNMHQRLTGRGKENYQVDPLICCRSLQYILTSMEKLFQIDGHDSNRLVKVTLKWHVHSSKTQQRGQRTQEREETEQQGELQNIVNLKKKKLIPPKPVVEQNQIIRRLYRDT